MLIPKIDDTNLTLHNKVVNIVCEFALSRKGINCKTVATFDE